jgi:molybdopterin molybdotransferase/putative molybdopterin biosynthesis protein
MKPQIENHLAALRHKRGFSAAALASAVGISRQTVYAIEAGTYVPNTAVALRLARALETGVEELFALAGESPAPELPAGEAELLPGSDAPEAGQPVQLCRVDRRLVASPPLPVPWYLPAGDAIVSGRPGQGGRTRLRIYRPEKDFRNRILVAGCDPGISVLARHVNLAGVELVLAHRNSSQALELLKQGRVHIAGTHLRDEASGESNLPEIGGMFPGNSVAVVSFAVWEEGILTAPGNPKGVRGIEDFARTDLRMVNREPGAGSRRLLDSHLERLQIDPGAVRGYENLAAGHLAAAWQVRTGAADCCIATRAAARLFGLGFLPLVSERYDLAIRRQHLDLPQIQNLLDTLSRLSFRRELESAGGYDTKVSGQRML